MSYKPTHVHTTGGPEIYVDCEQQATMRVRVDASPGRGQCPDFGPWLVLSLRAPNERSDDLHEVRVPLSAVRAAIAMAGKEADRG